MPDTSPTPAPKPPKPPIPWWAWCFAAACGIIPVITLGGAIPAAIGGGGAFGCIGVAREPKLSVATRVGICAAITGGCWALFITFAVIVAVLQARSRG